MHRTRGDQSSHAASQCPASLPFGDTQRESSHLGMQEEVGFPPLPTPRRLPAPGSLAFPGSPYFQLLGELIRATPTGSQPSEAAIPCPAAVCCGFVFFFPVVPRFASLCGRFALSLHKATGPGGDTALLTGRVWQQGRDSSRLGSGWVMGTNQSPQEQGRGCCCPQQAGRWAGGCS